MSKGPKAPKGGAPRPSPVPGAPYISAEQMVQDANAYRHLMHKPGQVKTPPDMETNPAFLDQIEILKSLAAITVNSDVLNKYATVYGGHESYEECMKISGNTNVMILLEALSVAGQYSDPEDPYDQGFLNLLKIIVSLYTGNPYSRDRIGYLMWAIAKHISPSCYFPLSFDLYYDPRLWHRPGEQPKPPLPIPPSYTFNGEGITFGPEDDIWDCELPDTGQGE